MYLVEEIKTLEIIQFSNQNLPMLPMPLEEDHVAAVELKTMVPEDYAKFYNHGPFTKTFFWLKATTSIFTFKTLS